MNNSNKTKPKHLFLRMALQTLADIKNMPNKKVWAWDLAKNSGVNISNIYRCLVLYKKTGLIVYDTKIGKQGRKSCRLTLKGLKVAIYVDNIMKEVKVE